MLNLLLSRGFTFAAALVVAVVTAVVTGVVVVAAVAGDAATS
ncbi:hypothetical protein [Actinoplanes teichomyceticus]|nr:hypothetical protein [Actinoplanes teichomyceticus]